MGGAGRKSREGCVETERMREGCREGGRHAVLLQPPFGVEEGHVYGLRVGLFFFYPVEKSCAKCQRHICSWAIVCRGEVIYVVITDLFS